MSKEEEKDYIPDPPEDRLVNKVSIKAATFNENSPSNWFRTLEAQFSLNGITVSRTKHLYVMSQLPTEVMDNVPDDILEGTDYDLLKSTIIEFYTKSKAEMFEKLISKRAVVGRPSGYLRSMQKTAANLGISDDILKHKFVQVLPSNIGTALAAQRSLTLTEMGNMADELVPTFNTDQIQNVKTENWNNSPQRSPGWQSRNRNNNSASSQAIPLGLRPYGATQRPKVCRAHLYFADKARTCKPWCKFPGPKHHLSIQPSSRASSPARSESEN